MDAPWRTKKGDMWVTAATKGFEGSYVSRGQLEMADLLDEARRLGLPMLAGVDEYDDTVFTKLQIRSIVDELAKIDGSGSLGPAIDELLRLIKSIEKETHCYLVFIGY